MNLPVVVRVAQRLWRFRRRVGLFLVGWAILAAACAAPGAETEPSSGLLIQDATARPSALAHGTSAVYLTVVNQGRSPDRLQRATTPAAAVTETHETVNDQGIMRMEYHPDGFEVPAGGRLELKPGGKHLMLIDLAQPLTEGDSIPLTLTFAQAGTLEITVPVTAAAGH